MSRHYHVPEPEDVDAQGMLREVVYARESDAKDYLADVRRRAALPQTGFTTAAVRGLKIRACDEPACMGGA